MFLIQVREIAAWAHLILYGEEATRKAQKEGEEAAAAYEQEKKDIAEGKILPPPPKPEKKKSKTTKKTKGSADGKKDASNSKPGRKRKHDDDGAGEPKKKAKPGPRPSQKADKESLAPVLAKGLGRVSRISCFQCCLKFGRLVPHSYMFAGMGFVS